jgi:hypothetical protein
MGNKWDWDDHGYTELPSERAVDGADGPTGRLAVISQQLIDKYLELEAQDRAFRALKEQLKRALVAGASVEPGPHRLELQVREQRALTVNLLVDALGLSAEEVAELKGSAPPRRLHYLVVR